MRTPYEYVVVTQEFEKCDEMGQRQLDAYGSMGYWVVTCVTWSKYITWTMCRHMDLNDAKPTPNFGP